MSTEQLEFQPDPIYDPGRLLAVASELQTWTNDLPLWRAAAEESLGISSTRLRDAESVLASKLRRLPTCHLLISKNGQDVEFSLADVQVRSAYGLTSACRTWIAKVRKQAIPQTRR